MNILISPHYFHPHIGGIESVVATHASHLADRGHSVTVVSSDIGADTHRSRKDGYQVERYRAWNPIEQFGIPYPVPHPMSVRGKVRDVVRNESIDIAHLHGMNYLTTSAVLRCLPPEIPVILHQHTPYVDYPLPLRLIEDINDNTIGRWNIRQSDHILCVSPEIKRYVTSLVDDISIDILSNGIDIERFQGNSYNKSDVFSCNGSETVFFTISRMSQKKGVDVLLESVREVSQRNIDAHIAIAGDGPMREDIEETIQELDNVEMMGRLSDEKLLKCYATADVFLFTSKSGEAFPTLTMMEAYASGTPVIASRLSNNGYGIIDGENTILVEPNNSSELADAIYKLATDSELVGSMSEKARESAEQYFTIESRIDNLEECYESLLDRSETDQKRSSN